MTTARTELRSNPTIYVYDGDGLNRRPYHLFGALVGVLDPIINAFNGFAESLLKIDWSAWLAALAGIPQDDVVDSDDAL